MASISARIAWEASVGRAFASFPGVFVRSSIARLFDRRWMETLLPLILACLTFTTFAILVPHYLSVMNVQQLMRDFAEPGLVAVAMSITILAGGIDLSVGATFALADFVALFISHSGPFAERCDCRCSRNRCRRRNAQRPPDRLRQGSAVSDNTRHAAHPARGIQSRIRGLYDRIGDRAQRNRRLGFPGRRFDTGCSGEHVGALRGRARQPRFSHPHSPGSAYHGRGRKPQSGAPRRDRRAPLAAVGLYSERSDRGARRPTLCGATERRRLRYRAWL